MARIRQGPARDPHGRVGRQARRGAAGGPPARRDPRAQQLAHAAVRAARGRRGSRGGAGRRPVCVRASSIARLRELPDGRGAAVFRQRPRASIQHVGAHAGALAARGPGWRLGQLRGRSERQPAARPAALPPPPGRARARVARCPRRRQPARRGARARAAGLEGAGRNRDRLAPGDAAVLHRGCALGVTTRLAAADLPAGRRAGDCVSVRAGGRERAPRTQVGVRPGVPRDVAREADRGGLAGTCVCDRPEAVRVHGNGGRLQAALRDRRLRPAPVPGVLAQAGGAGLCTRRSSTGGRWPSVRRPRRDGSRNASEAELQPASRETSRRPRGRTASISTPATSARPRALPASATVTTVCGELA